MLRLSHLVSVSLTHGSFNKVKVEQKAANWEMFSSVLLSVHEELHRCNQTKSEIVVFIFEMGYLSAVT